jgi:hypothetical protein
MASKLTAKTEDNAPAGPDLGLIVKTATTSRKRYLPDWNLLPDGFANNYSIAVSVASSDLTVALKTKSGGNASATDPITLWLGGSYRRCTAALSRTLADATNWFNSGAAVTAALEIDYFVYAIWNTTPATDIMDIGFARVPNGRVFSDFSTTTTNDRYLAFSNASTPTSTDYCTVIGRFGATLSAGAGYTWTVPTFTNKNLIQYPVYNTRLLTFALAPTGYSAAPTDTSYQYQIDGDFNTLYIREATAGTSNGTGLTGTAPLTAATVTNGAWGGFGTGVDNGANLTTTVRAAIASAGTTITFNPNGSSTATWTGSSTKRLATVQLSYQI